MVGISKAWVGKDSKLGDAMKACWSGSIGKEWGMGHIRERKEMEIGGTCIVDSGLA